jgi:Glucodextranase, domain B/Bacterial Ig domain
MAVYYYKQENRKTSKKTGSEWKTFIFYSFLTVFAAVAFFVVGIRILTGVARLITGVGDNQVVTIKDTTPPPPPRIDNTNPYTKESLLTITGSTEPGSTVRIRVPESSFEREVFVSESGNFTSDVNLQEGANTIQATTIDNAGNESRTSSTKSIILDTKAPELTVKEPEDGQSKRGRKEKDLTISGQTSPDARLTLNGRVVVVNPNGSFTTVFTLSDGENPLDLIATDEAGNQTEVKIKINYSS